MGLRDLPIPRTKIEVGGGSFEVRGIALGDILLALKDFGPQMALLYARITADPEHFREADIQTIIFGLVQEFPELVAAIIALASDDFDPKTIAQARRLPLPKQVEAVEAIFGLTFTSEAEVGKLLESLARMLERVTETLAMAKARPSVTGIGESAAA